MSETRRGEVYDWGRGGRVAVAAFRPPQSGFRGHSAEQKSAPAAKQESRPGDLFLPQRPSGDARLIEVPPLPRLGKTAGDGGFFSQKSGAFLPDEFARLGALVAKAAGGGTVRDLLFHMPDEYLDRRSISHLADARPGELATFCVTIRRIDKPAKKTSPIRVIAEDESASVTIILFAHKAAYAYEVGARMYVTGEIAARSGGLEMQHPQQAVSVDAQYKGLWVEPSWGLTKGLTRGILARLYAAVLRRMPDYDEWIHPSVVAGHGLPSFREALIATHAPSSPPPDSVRRRLAYDEAFARTVSMLSLKRDVQSRPGISIKGDRRLCVIAGKRFGFPLTPDQVNAVREIVADMESDRRMLRLLQGDVGAGKTIVAAMCMLTAAEAGYQSALLAPTEILAKQHFAKISELSPVPTVLLVGGQSAQERKKAIAMIQSGEALLVVGTHAIFQEKVVYKNLGLAIIDEQHRFGVDDRLTLTEKGDNVNTLVMTATPIPRSVLLGKMGWMAVSVIKGKPNGRKPIKTTTCKTSRLEDVYSGVRNILAGGGRVYWVCPLVHESEASDLADAVARHAELKARFGDIVGIAHGQQSSDDRDAALRDFAEGRKTVLVSTTVVEVGVDVPQANLMVIEHAERFGAAQLHQLRGRVGRGSLDSYCLLLHPDSISQNARKRLTLLTSTNDGFEIAEADFKLRGGGDTLGKQQTGQTVWRIAKEEAHEDIIDLARRDATHFYGSDPAMSSERGKAVRTCLEIFDLATAHRYSTSG